jgi:DNA primase
LPYFSEQTIAQVRDATDLLALVSERVQLQRAGPDSYKGLCPFHSEKTPSFTVSPTKGFFYCFGCNVGGDAIRFLRLSSGLSFPEAVRELARRNGIPLPETGERDSLDGGRAKARRLYELMDRAAKYFSDNLWDSAGTRIRNYLRKRGVGDGIARDFRLGYSLPGWDGLTKALVKEGWEEALLLEAGLAKPREIGGVYDTFRDRLMIPVLERDGRTAAFAGRVMDSPAAREARASRSGDGPGFEPPKYINSPATPIYTKGRLLYGLPQAAPFLPAAGCVFLVEGYFDLIALHSAGVRYAVASMGTALTQTQANLLRAKDAEVLLLFDGDRAGREAARKALPRLLNAGLRGRVVLLPEEHDPDTFIREHGPEALMELAETAPTALDYAVSRILEAHGEGLESRLAALTEIRELHAEVDDPALAQLLCNSFASRLGIDPATIPLPGRTPREPRREEDVPPDSQDGHPVPRSPRPEASPEDPRAAEVDIDDRSAALLEHVLRHPETAVILESMTGAWPTAAAGALASELLAQLAASGTVTPARLSQRWREGRAGEFVARAGAEGRKQEPETAWVSAQEDAALLLLDVKSKQLLSIRSRLREAAAQEDFEAVRRLNDERTAITFDIDRLTQTRSPLASSGESPVPLPEGVPEPSSPEGPRALP